MILEYVSSYLCLIESPGLKVCFQAQLLLEEATCEQQGKVWGAPAGESALSTAVGQSQNGQPAAGDAAWRQSRNKTGWTGGTPTKAFKVKNVSTVSHRSFKRFACFPHRLALRCIDITTLPMCPRHTRGHVSRPGKISSSNNKECKSELWASERAEPSCSYACKHRREITHQSDSVMILHFTIHF